MIAVETLPKVGGCLVEVLQIDGDRVHTWDPSTGNWYVNSAEVFLASVAMVYA